MVVKQIILACLAVMVFEGIPDAVLAQKEDSRESSKARSISQIRLAKQAKVLLVSCRAYACDPADSPRREETKTARRSGFYPSLPDLGSFLVFVQLTVPLGKVSWQTIKRLPCKLTIVISDVGGVDLFKRTNAGTENAISPLSR